LYIAGQPVVRVQFVAVHCCCNGPPSNETRLKFLERGTVRSLPPSVSTWPVNGLCCPNS
jgi:hypothetical protein